MGWEKNDWVGGVDSSIARMRIVLGGVGRIGVKVDNIQWAWGVGEGREVV